MAYFGGFFNNQQRPQANQNFAAQAQFPPQQQQFQQTQQSAPPVQPVQQTNPTTPQNIDEQPFEVPRSDQEAVNASVRARSEQKDVMLANRAISQRVENRLLKALAFAKLHVVDEEAQALLAIAICDNFNVINAHILKSGGKPVEYVPAVEVDVIKDEDKQITQNLQNI